MPIPPVVRKFGQLSKAENAATAKALDEMMLLPDGRSVSKRMFLEFEIEKMLQSGRSQSDIMKSLEAQGLKGIDPNYVKGRIGVARNRNARLKADPRYAGMEATWIIENGLNHKKTWEEISDELVTSGFNGPKLTEIYKDRQAKRIQQGNSAPAVIDQLGDVPALEARLARAREVAKTEKTVDAREEVIFVEGLLEEEKKRVAALRGMGNQARGPAVAAGGGSVLATEGLEPDAQEHPTQRYKGLAEMNQKELSAYLMEGFNEAKARFGDGRATPMEGIDLDMMTETIKMWGEGKTDRGSRVRELDLTEGAAPRGKEIERPTGLSDGPP